MIWQGSHLVVRSHTIQPFSFLLAPPINQEGGVLHQISVEGFSTQLKIDPIGSKISKANEKGGQVD